MLRLGAALNKKMRVSSGTKIYIDCRSLLDEILNITVDFPKAYKFTIGTKMQWKNTNKLILYHLLVTF